MPLSVSSFSVALSSQEILTRVGCGDISPKGAMERLGGDGVVFKDGSREKIDAIVDRTKGAGGEVVGLLKTGSAGAGFKFPVLDAETEGFLWRRKAELSTEELKEDRVLPRLSDLWRYKFTIGRSGVIGTLVGIIPGVGEDIGAWASYAAAKRSSKEKDQFGKGSHEGLTAAETGNSAVVPGALGQDASGAGSVIDAGNQGHGPRRAVAQGEHGRQKQQQRHDQTDRLGQEQQDVEHAQNLPMKAMVAPFIMSRRTLGTKPKNTRSAIRIARGRICQPDRSTLASSCQRGLGGPKKA